MTPREAALAIDGAAEGEVRRLRHLQGVAYTHSQLTAYAVNDPRKMPDYRKVFPDPRRAGRGQTPQEAFEAMQAWTTHLSVALRPRAPRAAVLPPAMESLQ